MKDFENIKKAVKEIEQLVNELKDENIALKKAIISACNVLTHQNSQMARQVISFEKSFKEPKWLQSED